MARRPLPDTVHHQAQGGLLRPTWSSCGRSIRFGYFARRRLHASRRWKRVTCRSCLRSRPEA